jgi:uncharacterized protein (TIGR00255 family)
MIRSMTGFGSAQATLPGKKLSIEVRTLNSKQLDLNLRLPSWLGEKEQEIRNLISQTLERGKVNVQISIERNSEAGGKLIDRELALEYFREISSLAEATGYPSGQVLPMVMRMPDITRGSDESLEPEQWIMVQDAFKQALKQVDEFRAHEGGTLSMDLKTRLVAIQDYSRQISLLETPRIERIRGRIRQELLSSFREGDYDAGRFEQELIFYLERLDITEERVRLSSHCDFFLQTLGEDGANGRKLGFISQEMGREINTIGSKANDLTIQKLVVGMKDELEKIKEQLLNIL